MSEAGYASPAYAAALFEFGEARQLERCGGQILVRPIPEGEFRDGVGCYPLFLCRDWSRLNEDAEQLGDSIVSLSLVTDPFACVTEETLRRTFQVVNRFKEHFVIDTHAEWAPTKHHRYYSRRALQSVEVGMVDGREHLDDWERLFGVLRDRHRIDDARAFSFESFRRQMTVPGLVAFAARAAGEIVAMQLWYVVGEVAYNHLAAADETGYALGASYALHDAAIAELRSRVRWIHLGAGSGLDGGDEGLTQFKRGWANGTRTAYFCGRICDPATYARLSASAGGGFFPAYRTGLR